jgi:signal transduction histidine kinase
MPDLFRSVQVRLVGWTVVVTAAFIVVFSAAMYAQLERSVERRTDESLADTCHEMVQAVAQEGSDGRRPIGDVVREEADEFVVRNREVAVFTADGALVAASRRNRVTPLTGIGAVTLRGVARATTRGRALTIDSYRLYALPFTARGTRFVVLTARHREEQEELLESVREVFWLAAPLWIALTGLAGWWLVRKSLQPVRIMSEQQRRFMADASHELRTPLSIVRGESEVALARERPPAELRDALGVIQHESELLTAIVDDLFLLARADSGQRLLSPTRFYLNELLTDAARAVRTLADEKQITLHVDAPHDVTIEADERLLARMIGNLLENGVKYTPRGGRVTLTLTTNDGAPAITIRDTGPGVSAGEQTRIFERFYRGARNEGEGAGLGLAIARSIAELHGARLELAETSSAGSVFRVTLPG